MSNQISILNQSIRQVNDLYSLADLHKASGNAKKHQPTNFIRFDTTQGLIKEIQNEQSSEMRSAIKVINGGNARGTYVCEELVLAYAMWISPKFHLVVLRAFLAMHKGQSQPQQLALPEERKFTFEFTEHELQQLVWGWFVLTRGIDTMQQIYPAMEKLGSKHSAAIYGQAFEYLNVQREVHKTLMRITSDINADPMNNWRALNHLRALYPATQNEKQRN